MWVPSVFDDCCQKSNLKNTGNVHTVVPRSSASTMRGTIHIWSTCVKSDRNSLHPSSADVHMHVTIQQTPSWCALSWHGVPQAESFTLRRHHAQYSGRHHTNIDTLKLSLSCVKQSQTALQKDIQRCGENKKWANKQINKVCRNDTVHIMQTVPEMQNDSPYQLHALLYYVRLQQVPTNDHKQQKLCIIAHTHRNHKKTTRRNLSPQVVAETPDLNLPCHQ